MSFSVHVDNTKSYILILGESHTHTLTAEIKSIQLFSLWLERNFV